MGVKSAKVGNCLSLRENSLQTDVDFFVNCIFDCALDVFRNQKAATVFRSEKFTPGRCRLLR